jgi:hypothetical protein
MKRFVYLASVVVAMGMGAAGVSFGQERPLASARPSEAFVLGALRELPAGMIRTDVSVVFEEISPGSWKCTVYYTESKQLPFGIVVPGTRFAQDVYVDFGRTASIGMGGRFA